MTLLAFTWLGTLLKHKWFVTGAFDRVAGHSASTGCGGCVGGISGQRLGLGSAGLHGGGSDGPHSAPVSPAQPQGAQLLRTLTAGWTVC